METAVYEMPVSGMTCRPCEDTILEAVLAVPGVLRAEVSYWKSTVRITYNPALTTADVLGDLLTGISYVPCRQAHGGLQTNPYGSSGVGSCVSPVETAIARHSAGTTRRIAAVSAAGGADYGNPLHLHVRRHPALADRYERSAGQETPCSARLYALSGGTAADFTSSGVDLWRGGTGADLFVQTEKHDLHPVRHGGAANWSLLLGNFPRPAPHSGAAAGGLPSAGGLAASCRRKALCHWHSEWPFALRRFQRHVALCRLQRQRAAGRRFHAGLVSGHAAGNGDLFNSGKDASRQSTAHISALYSGGNAGGRNRHGDQGHRVDKVIIQHDGHMEFCFRNGMKYKSK